MNLFAGKVIQGEKLGRQIGFPTANIDGKQFSKIKPQPQWGVYAGLVLLPNQLIYPAGIVIGPADTKGEPKLEAHLIGFFGDLYDQNIGFLIIKFLRPYQSFSSLIVLKKQIKKDLAATKKIIKPYLEHYVTTH
mgnify:CR=1 FL=1